ncbi:hypothetical protein [Prosthecobacter sp.]|uniref:GAP1-N2 domain-containing protein n=1 Tax=Prosthecobacter sp. TaxID=1965333 RepID=UPI0037840F9E
MAWQLIYTSAPRLLEAGRTGFGTVARHRAVSGMLAAAVERFSQFARLPGHDPRRVVHTCRILTVGSSTYHVLSCLQDAGSDYTGRTNHIAHHLIAEPREVRALAAAGITPADVLLGMSWRTTWSEGPRFLDSAEEIDLASFASRPSHAWSAVTGNPASASLLWSREALKGCYLITPPGANVLELFRESLLASQAQAWQTRFTTCLEPNDDLADFRWVALASSSPMRSQVENSSRLVLDLTHPSSLPPLPELDEPAASSEVAAPAVPSLPPPLVQGKAAPKMALPTADSAPISTMGGWSPDSRQKAPRKGRSYIAISLVIAALLIFGVGGGLFWQFNQQQQQKKSRNAYEASVEKVWKENHLILDDTKKFLVEQPVLEDGRKLLKSHEDFFRSMKKALAQPENAPPLSLPTENKDDLATLKDKLEEFAALHVRPWEKLLSDKNKATAASLYEAYRKWESSRNAAWKKLAAFVELDAPPPPSAQLLDPLKTLAKEVFSLAEPSAESRIAWTDLFDSLGMHKTPADAEALRWLKLWEDLSGPTPRDAAEKSHADNSLPAWLLAKAKSVKEKQDKASAGQMAEQNKKDSPGQPAEQPKPQVVMDDADALPPKHDIHIVLLKTGDDPTGKIQGLKVAADMQLFIGEAADAHPAPAANTEPKDGQLKPLSSISMEGKDDITFGPGKFSPLHEMIRFSSSGSLLALPEKYRGTAGGLRMVGRSKDGVHVLFDLRLIPLASAVSKPILAKEIPASADNFAAATLRLPEGFIPRIHITGLPGVVYSLRLDGTASEQKTFDLKPVTDSSFEVVPPQAKVGLGLSLQEIRQQIAELEKGIAKDDADAAALENTKLSAREKEARKAGYTKARTEKEIQLQTLRPKLQSLEGQQTVHFDLMPGRYTLLLDQPNGKLEFCKLIVTAAAKSSAPKPPAP